MRSTVYGKAPFYIREISSLACVFSRIKIFFSNYTESLNSRKNEVYVFFKEILLKKMQQYILHLLPFLSLQSLLLM